MFDDIPTSARKLWECKWIIGFFLKLHVSAGKSFVRFHVSAGKLCMHVMQRFFNEISCFSRKVVDEIFCFGRKSMHVVMHVFWWWKDFPFWRDNFLWNFMFRHESYGCNFLFWKKIYVCNDACFDENFSVQRESSFDMKLPVSVRNLWMNVMWNESLKANKWLIFGLVSLFLKWDLFWVPMLIGFGFYDDARGWNFALGYQ